MADSVRKRTRFVSICDWVYNSCKRRAVEVIFTNTPSRGELGQQANWVDNVTELGLAGTLGPQLCDMGTLAGHWTGLPWPLI